MGMSYDTTHVWLYATSTSYNHDSYQASLYENIVDVRPMFGCMLHHTIATELSLAKLHALLCLQAPGHGGRCTCNLVVVVHVGCDLLGRQALTKGEGQQSKTFV